MSRPSALETAHLCRALAAGAERGAPPAATLGLIAANAARRAWRQALERAAASLRDGAKPGAALRAAGLSEEFCAQADLAAEHGSLAPFLQAVAEEQDARQAIGRRVRLMVLYVSSGLAVGGAIVMVLGSLVTRVFLDVYESLGMRNLPQEAAWVRTLFGDPRVVAFILIVLFGFAAALYPLARWFSRTFAVYLVPLWGAVQKSRDLAAFCGGMSIHIAAGGGIPEGLRRIQHCVANRRLRRRIARLRRRVEDGAALSTALFEDRFFPRALTWAVGLAESRGDVQEALASFSHAYVRQVRQGLDAAAVLVVPVGILIVANMLVWVMLTIISPMFQIQSALSG